MCRSTIKVPIPNVDEAIDHWWDLLDSILNCKKVIKRIGVGADTVSAVVRLWKQRNDL